MFTQYTDEQVTENWAMIKAAIEESMPMYEEANLATTNNILMAVLSGSMQVWASFDTDGESSTIKAIAVTKLIIDPITDVRSVLIHNLFGFVELSDMEWDEGFLVLGKWAAAQGCTRMTAYTDQTTVIERAVKLKAKTTMYLSIPLIS